MWMLTVQHQPCWICAQLALHSDLLGFRCWLSISMTPAVWVQAARVDVYVADRFIGWQETALQFMALHLTDASDAASFGKLTGPLLEEVSSKQI